MENDRNKKWQMYSNLGMAMTLIALDHLDHGHYIDNSEEEQERKKRKKRRKTFGINKRRRKKRR